MADKKRKNIETDPIADNLARKDAVTPIKLIGRFLGNSDSGDFYRLYMTEELNHYLEFPKDATIEAKRFPSGRLVVWLKRGTQVREVTTRSGPVEFLRGRILRQYSGTTSSGSGLWQVRDFLGCNPETPFDPNAPGSGNAACLSSPPC